MDEHFDSRLKSNYHLYRNSFGVYGCTLNKVSLKDNSNKYAIIQLLESNNKKAYVVFTRFGRVGYSGKLNYDIFLNQLEAIDAFYGIFNERTSESWTDRNKLVDSIKTKGSSRYTYVQMDYEDMETDTKPNKPMIMREESMIPTSVQKLIKFICDPQKFTDAMEEFHLDITKIPLGRLSSNQINKAYRILNDLSIKLKDNAITPDEIIAYSDQFYSTIPHATGMYKLEQLNNPTIITQKLDLLKALDDMKEAGAFIKDTKIPDYDKILFQYNTLNCKISHVTDINTLSMIRSYIETNRGHHNLKMAIRDVYEVSRQGEDTRFLNQGNVQLLWHGSRVVNFIGILSQGLRINPANAVRTGSMFGNGIYFANSASKSGQYMGTLTGESGLILLCEVSLGVPLKLTQAQYINRPPVGHHSVHGVGTQTPDVKSHIKINENVVVPIGKLVQSNAANVSLLYDEYIVYDQSQVRLKYLIWVDN